jgi:hypothetical protein
MVLLLGVLAACSGPGPLTPAEVRWRWRHGQIVEAAAVSDAIDRGVLVTFRCPADAAGNAKVATTTLWTTPMRERERMDPWVRGRDPLQWAAWRACDP